MQETHESELELATMNALRGTENVKQRLLLEMSTGTPAISDLAYAVKVRVKEDYRVVEKVRRKRSADKLNYDVSSLRDLVGLRVVTLYRLDALQILPILLERIEAGRQVNDSVFGPRGIEEIIIYSTNPTGDAQDLPGRVEALCRAFGLSEKTSVEQTPQNYTSIHIVVWCRGKYRSAYRDIPVEVQVRTAFEDVWGEIDHSLKYKREAIFPHEPDRAERLELNEAHLNVMKTLIDGLAQYGDQVKLQMEGDARIRASGVRHSEQAVDRLAQIDGLDDSARHLVEMAVLAAQESLEPRGDPGSRRIALRQAAAGLIRAAEKVRAMKPPEEHLEELLYVIEMERALLLLELGNDLGGAGGNSALVEASRIYGDMVDRFPSRVVPLYRLARTYDELGDRPAALSQYRAAVQAIEHSDLSEHHWLRSAAPRLLGFACWEGAVEQLRATAEAAERENALKQLLKAIDLTSQALAASGAGSDEASKSRNNLLYFILDYRKHGGAEADLEARGFGEAGVTELLQELVEAAGEEFSRWDTLREAFVALEDVENALAAADKVIELLQVPQRRERWSSLESLALSDARATIVELREQPPDSKDA